MRGSAAPVRDAKYGIPLHKTPQPPRPWQGITHMPEAELPIRRPAPLVSPAETPELAHICAPAPAIPLLSSEDCYKDDAQRGPELTPGRARGMRASHDVLQISTPALRGNSPPPNADTADTLPPCTPATPPAPEHAEGLACTDARVGARANALPHDIVTAMALALGAPERPARQSQPDGSKRLAALGEDYTATHIPGSMRFGDTAQNYGRVCDLLFFGDELPLALSLVEVLPAGRHHDYSMNLMAKERVLPCLLSVFLANDQLHRLLRACTLQQMKQSKNRKEALSEDCTSKTIIVAVVEMFANDYLHYLIAPTIRALQGPWTANEAGLKGALDRFLSRFASTDAPPAMRDALKTIHMGVAKKYGTKNANITIAHLLMGELLTNTVQNIHSHQQPEQRKEALTTEGSRFLASMTSVLAKLSMNESFSGGMTDRLHSICSLGSKLYHMNGWIQSNFERFEKAITKTLSGDEPALVVWNSGSGVKGAVQNFHVLLRCLSENKEKMHRMCMSSSSFSFSSATISSYQTRCSNLWSALDGARRRGHAESVDSSPRSRRTGALMDADWGPEDIILNHRSAMKQNLKDIPSTGDFQASLQGFSTQPKARTDAVRPPTRMEQLSASVSVMDLESRDMTVVPKLDHFQNLQVLNMPRNRLTELGTLPPSLRTLDCSYNQLANLKGVQWLCNLEILDASHNIIHEVASGLSKCHRITKLDLSHNHLQALVDCSHMQGLRHLCLSHNQIHGLHDLRTYGLNPNLKSITIDGNPLCEKEPSYFALASAMLPQVDLINDVSVALFEREITPRPSPFIVPSSASPGITKPPPLSSTRSTSPLNPGESGSTDQIVHTKHGTRANQKIANDSKNRKPYFNPDLNVAQILGIEDAASIDGGIASGYESSSRKRELATTLSNSSAGMQAVQQGESSTISNGQVSSVQVSSDKEMCESRYQEEAADKTAGDIDTDRERLSIDLYQAVTERVAKRPVKNAKASKTLSLAHTDIGRDPGHRAQSAMRMLVAGALHELNASMVNAEEDEGRSPRTKVLEGTGLVGNEAKMHAKTKSTRRDSVRASPARLDSSASTAALTPEVRGRYDTQEKNGQPVGIEVDPRRSKHCRRELDARDSPSRISAAKSTPSKPSRVLRKKSTSRESLIVGKCPSSSGNDLRPVDMAEMAMEVEHWLRTMSLVFKGWKLLCAHNLLTDRLTHAACRLVLVPESQYRILALLPFLRSWADVQAARVHRQSLVDKGLRRERLRMQCLMLKQILFAWSSTCHAQTMLEVMAELKGTRKVQKMVQSLFSHWVTHVREAMRQNTHIILHNMYKMRKRFECSVKSASFEGWKIQLFESNRHLVLHRRILRMRFNRQAGAVFEAFLELRERALHTERTARAVSTRQHLRNMRAALFAWQHYLSTKTIRINQGLLFVRRNCNSVFHLSPPGLDRFFREWYQQSSRKARLLKMSVNSWQGALQKVMRAALTRFARHREVHQRARSVIARLVCSSQRLQGVAVLRRWRQAVVRMRTITVAHVQILTVYAHKFQQHSLRAHWQTWHTALRKEQRNNQIMLKFSALMADRERRRQSICLHSWICWHIKARKDSFRVVSYTQRTRRQRVQACFSRIRMVACLASKTKKAVTRSNAILQRLITRRALEGFLQAVVDDWFCHVRRKRNLRRHLPVWAMRRRLKDSRGALHTWYYEAHRRFHVASMLDKILLKRKLHSVADANPSV